MYFISSFFVFSLYVEKILAANNAAFSPASTPIVAVGTPGGISIMLSRESIPNRLVVHGTPITGFVVWETMAPVSIVDRLETEM